LKVLNDWGRDRQKNEKRSFLAIGTKKGEKEKGGWGQSGKEGGKGGKGKKIFLFALRN